MDYETTDDLRKGIEKYHEQLKNLKSNMSRIEREYSDLEDLVSELEQAIEQAMKDAGLRKEEVLEKVKESGLDILDM